MIATLYYTAVAFPLLPSTEPTVSVTSSMRSHLNKQQFELLAKNPIRTVNFPIQEIEATTESTVVITTSATLPTAEPTSTPADPSAPAGGVPGSLAGFLEVHNQVSVVHALVCHGVC